VLVWQKHLSKFMNIKSIVFLLTVACDIEPVR